VVLLDEIDKLGVGWQGSPEAALLEVLDPEQNKTFTDHYLELPFDLSEVLFLCTANDPRHALRPAARPPRGHRDQRLHRRGEAADRPEIPGPQAAQGPRDPRGHADVTDEALRAIVRDYTREAGVRQLEREVTRLCALARARGGAQPTKASASSRSPRPILGRLLGKARFFNEVAERTQAPGVATGLAWTPVGGDILFIETTRMPGKGRIEITGQLGDVMKESARAALSYVKQRRRAGRRRVAPRRPRTCTSTCPPAACPRTAPPRA
jgi:ATP-dependent Lon protease